MAYIIDEILDDDLITIENRFDELGVYEFRVGSLDTLISVTVSRLPLSEEARYEMTHAIKTPLQVGPYYQGRPFWDNIPYALHQAISSITSYYRDAINKGHTPSESWLVDRR